MFRVYILIHVCLCISLKQVDVPVLPLGNRGFTTVDTIAAFHPAGDHLTEETVRVIRVEVHENRR